MVENVTLGQIAEILSFIIVLGGGVTGIYAWIAKPFKKREEKQKARDEELKVYITQTVKTEIEPVKVSIDKMREDQKKSDLEACKNFIVQYLANLERGLMIDEIETQRFWEEFRHYEKLGGNGYIHSKVEKLKNEGLL